MKLPYRDKIIWKNFLQALLVYTIASVLLSMRGGDGIVPFSFNLRLGFTTAAFMCVPILCWVMALRFDPDKNKQQ